MLTNSQSGWTSCKACFIFFPPALFLTTQLLTLHRRWEGTWVLGECSSLEMLNCGYGHGGPHSTRGELGAKANMDTHGGHDIQGGGQCDGCSGAHTMVNAQGSQE